MEQPTQQHTYLVLYKPGPTWLTGQPVSQQPLKEHGRYLLQLHAQEVLEFARPFLNDAGGAAVITARDGAEANALIKSDPAVVSRVFGYELHPWALVPWGRHLEAKQAR